MKAALSFKNQPALPRQKGEKARVKVIHGPDYGTVYVLIGARATIGRGEDCDLTISDLKASRKHAEVLHSTKGWIIQDLGSANGILHNGNLVRSAGLDSKDTFTIGETYFEFHSADAEPLMLTSAQKSVIPKRPEKVPGTRATESKNPKSVPVAALQSKRNLMIGAALFIIAVLFFGNDQKGRRVTLPSKSRDPEVLRDLSSYLPQEGAAGINRTAQMFFKAGFREYREGNFLRAKAQFETVLQIAPGHPLARRYIDICNHEIEDEVKFHIESGKRGHDTGKLKEARGHFEAVMRLLYKDPNNPAFIEAKDQLSQVNKEIAEGGES